MNTSGPDLNSCLIKDVCLKLLLPFFQQFHPLGGGASSSSGPHVTIFSVNLSAIRQPPRLIVIEAARPGDESVYPVELSSGVHIFRPTSQAGRQLAPKCPRYGRNQPSGHEPVMFAHLLPAHVRQNSR
jgi:hypothetical protein